MAQPGVNFTNILQAAFMCEDPKSVKIQSSCWYLFALLGSLRVKATHRNIDEIWPQQHET